jgi:hypothetical protein
VPTVLLLVNDKISSLCLELRKKLKMILFENQTRTLRKTGLVGAIIIAVEKQ